MMSKKQAPTRKISTLCGSFILASLCGHGLGQLNPSADAAFQAYADKVETRLVQQHRSSAGFLASADFPRLRQGELAIERITPSGGTVLPGALLHHWRGSAFVPGAKAEDFERLLRNPEGWTRDFAPEVVAARTLTRTGDHLSEEIRVRQQHGITVVMETNYDVTFGGLNFHQRYSLSRSSRILEIGSPGSSREHALAPEQEHGFLWRQNTYWSYEEQDGGLYLQIESLSLTRSIPNGLGWLVRPFVESIPRESLEFTLRSACRALSDPIDPTSLRRKPTP
jgi:hypothetical protein